MHELAEVLLFGDQTSSFEESLRRLLLLKGNHALISFFERTHYALRIEIAKLRDRQAQSFPRFTSLGDLVARYGESGNNPALDSALSVVYQFGCFIHYHKNRAARCFLSSKQFVIGMCTGLLTAVAVSCTQTVDELIPLAVEIVLIAFRTGVRTMQVGEGVQQNRTSSQSWSSLVPRLQNEAAAKSLATFCQNKNLPVSSQPWVSASSASSSTISGPPSILKMLFDTPDFTNFKPIPLPVHAPYHASHLYENSDIDDILGKTTGEILRSYAPGLPIISSVTGDLLVSSDLETLLRVVLSEILIRPISWEKAIKGCNALLNASNTTRCRVVPFASNSSQSLATALGATLASESKLDGQVARDAFSSELPTGRHEHSKIAVIGYSGRFPDAASPELFWDLLHQGRDVHKEVPPDRFNIETHYDPTGKKKNTSQTPYGCFINEPGLFDARFFHMSPKEAAQADPAQRLAILTAYEALEMSGFVPDRTPSTQRDRVGIFYGMTSDDWREVNSGQNVGTYFIPGGNRAFTPGRINYHFKFSGPSVSVDTACSSSLAAIHMACNSLWRNDCDMALAGGTNVMTNPDNFCGLDKGHFLSRTGNCKTFDDKADGYCRADGVGTIVLKRLEDAQADNDPICGVIAGAYTNHSAEADSITRPHVGAQAFIFKKVLNDAGVDPLEVSYIEMHGTGTQAGDAVEMKSVLDVFTPAGVPRSRHPLYLGSAKSNIGHGESASGVTSLIKVLLMMKENEIPPHCGIKGEINRSFPTDLQERGIRIAMEPVSWSPPEKGLRRVFLNNFSAAGGNTALLLEDAPNAPKKEGNNRSLRPERFHVVPISAKSRSALKKNVQMLTALINRNLDSGLSLSDLSYTTTARRMHHNYRIAVNGSNLTTIKEKLEQATFQDDYLPVPTVTPGIIFAFTGQGSIYAGMGRQLYTLLSFRHDIDYFDKIGVTMGFPTFKPLIDGTADDIQTMTPLVVQLGLTCMQMALARLWISWGVKPSAVVGHSLGEYAALFVAGVLSASDAIYLVGRRAQLLEEKCSLGTHSMLAVKASVSYMTTLAPSGHFEIACINAPDQTVICGLNSDIDNVRVNLMTLGIRCTKLAVAFAFHSSQVQPILADFESAAGGVVFHEPSIPIISPTLAAVITDAVIDNKYLGRQCRGIVDLFGAVQVAQAIGTVTTNSLWVEIGPDPIVCGMIGASISPAITTIASLRRKEDTWKVIAGALSAFYLAGINIRWNEHSRDFSTYPKTLQLPAYQWDYQNHWIQYVQDWCLTKGEAPFPPEIAKPALSKISTTTVQRLISEQSKDQKTTIVVESDLSNAQLNAIFQAHKVNGTALCPSSVYADIALTLGQYLRKFGPSTMDSGLDICNMIVEKPLIAKSQGDPLIFQASVTADWTTQNALVTYYSVTREGKKLSDHATCVIRYGCPNEWLQEWKRNAYLIKSRMDKLLEDVHNGQSQKIKRRMAYKLFGSFVEYDQRFQGMKEVVLDSDEYEATAHVAFQTTDHDGTFHTSPYWIDSLGHLSGFVMNGNDALDSYSGVFVNHGWESMRCSKTLSATAVYQTYVKMQPIGENLFAGDVYIFDGDTIIGVNQGVKFQGVPRRFLNILLPPAGPSQTQIPSTKGRYAQAPQITQPKEASIPRARPSLAHNQAASLAPPKSTSTSSFTVALSIIAEEIGIPVHDLSESSVFADLGVDSLLSLTISGRIREEISMDVESSIFVNCPTVADLRKRLEASPDEDDSPEPPQPQEQPPTPPSSPDSQSTADSRSIDGDDSETSVEDGDDLTALIAPVLAEEMGLPLDEILKSADLSELGLDSLLSLTVLGRLRETGMDLPLDYFSKNVSFARTRPTSGPKRRPNIETSVTAQITSISSRAGKGTVLPATSILLQGSIKKTTKTLFLFPDGSGSSTSYANLPKVGANVALVGLNCPYMKTPHDLKHSLEELTAPYVAEIQRRQPTGPYHLGGWSAGGICAYDAAQHLMRQGEQVAALVLLDSPFPIGLSKLPPRLYHFFDSIGLFGTGTKAPPAWLLPHFLAFVESLNRYEARPMGPGASGTLKTHLIWANDGVYESTAARLQPQADDTKEMAWLLNARTDFGPNGWDRLVGRENLRIAELKGANHFTMMEGEHAKEVARFIQSAME